MKRLLPLVVSIFIVIAFAMVGYAEETKQITGDVSAVDAKANTVTVKKMVKKEVKEVVLTVDDKTKITMDKEKKTLADLKAGDKVTARYVEKEGKNIAKSIVIKPPKKEAPKAEPAAPAKPEPPAKKPAAPIYPAY